MSPNINRTVLMSGVAFFSVQELNPYSDISIQPESTKAKQDFMAVKTALETAGVTVIQVDEPPECQDGIFTANWALCRGDTAVLSSLPPQRQDEQAWAEKYLQELGKKIVKPPYRFSGQGDCLPCGNLLFAGSGYRTDSRMHQFIADTLGYDVVSLQTIPTLDAQGKPVINHVTGWPDSFFYDIDLALAVITPDLIAWCPDAFMPESQRKIEALPLERIAVSATETKQNFACNLVSTGSTVIMSAQATELQSALKARGFNLIAPPVTELVKGGGYIRCTTLTLDND
jgi:N-dimethylarginine dimethylaminohydrolase